MQANEIKFGIEIECIVPRNTWSNRPIGGYHRGVQVVDLPRGWKCESDASIRGYSNDEIGVEIVSPVLVGEAGLVEVLSVLDWLNSLGARVNRSTGLHVTVTFPVYDIKAMKRLLHFTARHEDAIFASTGSKWRATQCDYTSKIKETHRPLKDMDSRAWSNRRYIAANRYAILNLTHALRGNERVEFRAFAGTLNATKMAGYIQMVLGIVEKCTTGTRTAKWDRECPKWVNDATEGKGEGYKALYQLFVELGWSHRKGDRIKGLLGDRETLSPIKKKLFQMAEKFDR